MLLTSAMMMRVRALCCYQRSNANVFSQFIRGRLDDEIYDVTFIRAYVYIGALSTLWSLTGKKVAMECPLTNKGSMIASPPILPLNSHSDCLNSAKKNTAAPGRSISFNTTDTSFPRPTKLDACSPWVIQPALRLSNEYSTCINKYRQPTRLLTTQPPKWLAQRDCGYPQGYVKDSRNVCKVAFAPAGGSDDVMERWRPAPIDSKSRARPYCPAKRHILPVGHGLEPFKSNQLLQNYARHHNFTSPQCYYLQRRPNPQRSIKFTFLGKMNDQSLSRMRCQVSTTQ